MPNLGLCEPCFDAGQHVPAVLRIDGEPVCRAHARGDDSNVLEHSARVDREIDVSLPLTLTTHAKQVRETKAIPPKPERPLRGEHLAKTLPQSPVMCRRGCGKPTHRGLCAGQRTVKRVFEMPTPSPAQPPAASQIAAEPMEPAPPAPQPEKTRMDKLIFEVVDEAAVPSTAMAVVRNVRRVGELWERLLALEPGKRLKVANRSRDHAGTTNRAMKEKAKKHGRLYTSVLDGTWIFCRLEPKAGERA